MISGRVPTTDTILSFFIFKLLAYSKQAQCIWALHGQKLRWPIASPPFRYAGVGDVMRPARYGFNHLGLGTAGSQFDVFAGYACAET
jgi:hypothetical protein